MVVSRPGTSVSGIDIDREKTMTTRSKHALKMLLSVSIISGCTGGITRSTDTYFDKFVHACESSLIKRLKSPSTFSLIKITDISEPLDTQPDLIVWRDRSQELRQISEKRELTNSERLEETRLILKIDAARKAVSGDLSPTKLAAVLEYDAQNSFGTMLRSFAICEFKAWHEEFDATYHSDNVKIDGYTYTDWLLNQ